MNMIDEQLMKNLGLEALSPEEKAAIVEQFADVLFQAVLVRGMELLSEDKKDLLEEELKKDPDAGQDVFMDFFMANIPDFQSVIDDEMKRVKDRIDSVIGKPTA